MPSGLLNLNKPAGITSRDAVDLVQRLVRPAKVGHAGTLDPLATGVLVVCVGEATRLIEYVQRMPKRYVGTFLLGRSSPTEDIDGQVTVLEDPPVPSAQQVAAATGGFVGRLLQRPPAFSALKVGGRRAYDLARQGQAVKLPPRPIEVYALRAVRYEYPELVLEIECGGGTYVRSLGRDLAESLGTSAVMASLVRTAIGPWKADKGVDPSQLTAENWRAHLGPVRLAVSALPARVLTGEEIARVRRGLFIAGEKKGTSPICRDQPADGAHPPGEEVSAIDEAGRLIAILVPRGDGQWGAIKNFASGESSQ